MAQKIRVTKLALEDLELSPQAELRLELAIHDLCGLLGRDNADIIIKLTHRGSIICEIDVDCGEYKPQVPIYPDEFAYKRGVEHLVHCVR